MATLSLVSLQMAKDHLLRTIPIGDVQEPDLIVKLAQAQAVTLGYFCSHAYWRPIAEAWDQTTVPDVVIAAILDRLGELYRFRGDDAQGGGPGRDGRDDYSPLFREYLRQYHNPGIG
jgi:hypothetical protein